MIISRILGSDISGILCLTSSIDAAKSFSEQIKSFGLIQSDSNPWSNLPKSVEIDANALILVLLMLKIIAITAPNDYPATKIHHNKNSYLT